MKVIILNHYERLSPRVALEAEALRQNGYDVTLVKWCRNPGKASLLDQRENGFHVKWVTLNSPKGSLKILLSLPGLYKKIWKLLDGERFDVIHCTHFFLLPIAIFLAKKKKAKVVYDAYERYAADIAGHYLPCLNSVFKRLIEIVENFLVKRVNGILTISSPNEVLKKRYKMFCKNVELLYNVPLSLTYISELEIKRLRDMHEGRLIITYVGSLSKDRGLFELIEIVDLVRAVLHNVLLLVVGEFSSLKEKGAFLELIREKRLETHILLVPWLPYNNMLQYLKISHVGLAPYKQEWHFQWVGKGTSRKLFTYMQAGIPIVSTKFGEIANVVDEEGCGILLDNMSPEAIANAVIFLLKNENVAKEMGEKGRRAIMQKYNWEKESNKLLWVYKQIFEGGT